MTASKRRLERLRKSLGSALAFGFSLIKVTVLAHTLSSDVSLHVIAAADDGSPLRPHIIQKKNGDINGWTEPITDLNHRVLFTTQEAGVRDYLDAVIKNVDREAPIRGGRRQILIFTHGGMNLRKGAIERAFRLTPKLEGNYYPIFIAWNSEPFSCYGEHLLRIRQGQHRNWAYTLPTLPFYLLADISRGICRAPVVWTRLAENAITQPTGLIKNTLHAQRIVYGQEANVYLRRHGYPAPDVTTTNIRDSDFRQGETILPSVAHTVFAPTKAVGALVLDTIGTSSWDVMIRRANVLFDTPVREQDFDRHGDKRPLSEVSDRDRIARVTRLVQNRKPRERLDQQEIDREMEALLGRSLPAGGQKVDYHERARAGAVELLMQRLEVEQRAGKRYSITLVGHSMGAIVSNEILKRHPNLMFDRIEYLAAACSVKDCQDSVVPYLLKRSEQKRPAHFYNLSLHPIAEVSEALGGDPGAVSLGGLGKTAAGVVLVPQGSLLEWLDGFFTKPMTYEDRRLGKWGTAITSVGIFPEKIRPYVHLKMFPVGVSNPQVPEEHGSFADGTGEVKFWEESFIAPNPDPPYKRIGDRDRSPVGSTHR